MDVKVTTIYSIYIEDVKVTQSSRVSQARCLCYRIHNSNGNAIAIIFDGFNDIKSKISLEQTYYPKTAIVVTILAPEDEVAADRGTAVIRIDVPRTAPQYRI